MQRAIRLMALLMISAPAPSLAAGEFVVADRPGLEIAAKGLADGSLRLVHLDILPEAGSAPAPVSVVARPAGYPPRRPAILLAGKCDMTGFDPVWARFGTSPVWLLAPDPAQCDPAGIRAAFDKAASAPEEDRLAILRTAGLSIVAAPEPADSQTPSLPGTASSETSSKPAISGQLVISALPAGTGLGGGQSLQIAASEAPPPTDAAAAPAGATTPPAGTPAALPVTLTRRAGLPDPALVVGELATLLAANKRQPTGVPREVRDRIREIDPDFFALLLKEGNFDPENGQYVAAIQAELAGMNCYTGSIDGSWGNGSLSALQRYFSTLGAAQAADTPGPGLYREIVTHARVTCPTIRVEPARERPTASTGGRRTPPRGNTASRNPGRGSSASSTRGGGGNSGSSGNRPAANTGSTAPSRPRIDPNLVGGIGSGVVQ
ncbi:MAG: hypothetical protein ACK5LJ_13595 [Paracoccus sp. (in: a-proteobacteria)]